MSKLTLRCVAFTPFIRNTLRGFCRIHVAELRLTIGDIALHEKGAERWAALPAKPLMRDGRQVTEQRSGKPQFAQFLEFENRAVRDAFSAAVWAAVLEQYPEIATAEAAS